MAENLYAVSGIPIGIVDVDGTIYVKTGWQDICTKFHRVHPDTCKRCFISNKYVNTLNSQKKEEGIKKVNSSIDECVERIKIEFSDIYN